MGILQVLKDLFTTEEPPNLTDSWDIKPPLAGQDPQDVIINPAPTARYERQLGRLYNLYCVRNPSAEVLAEIQRYKDSINGLGYEAPQNSDEAQIQIDLLKG